jgi:hypothetical protein
MPAFRRLLLLALLAAPVAAGGKDEGAAPREVEVTLRAVRPTAEARLGYSRARSVAVETTVPRFIFEIPEFKAKDPLFFRFFLGQTEGVPFYGALDRSKEGDLHDLLYLDRDRDLDLTNDGDPVRARIRSLWNTGDTLVEFLDLEVAVPYVVEGKKTTEPYACLFYYYAGREGHPTTVQVERDGWRETTLKLGDEDYVLALLDDDTDGKFTTGDSWVMRKADTDRKEMLVRAATRSMSHPVWSEKGTWQVEVVGLDLAGRKAKVRVRPAEESERDYFLRIYRARQTPEERELRLDPLRPRVDDDETLDWLAGEGKDVAYALGVAASPNVNKRLLVEFVGPRCVWCARMARYTFRDREVFELCKSFVCAKVLFQPGTADTDKYGVDGTPTYVVLDTDGTEIARHNGFSRPEEFAAWLKAAMK